MLQFFAIFFGHCVLFVWLVAVFPSFVVTGVGLSFSRPGEGPSFCFEFSERYDLILVTIFRFYKRDTTYFQTAAFPSYSLTIIYSILFTYDFIPFFF